MTIKGPSRKQIIIPIVKSNAELIINLANQQIANINKSLKEIKSDITVDFICIINNGVIITTDKLANASNLKIIKKCIKNANNINSEAIESPQLPKSKLYLKIIRLSFMREKGPITPDIIKGIIKEMHIFNNITLASKSCVIKVLAKSDMVVVWINIQNSQSESAVKNIINQCFNVRWYIAIVYGTNMNPDVSQNKNCWKQRHLTLSCYSHVFRCAKCNRTHTTEHHRERMYGIAKRTRTLTEQPPKNVSYVLISSNALTAKKTIKQTVILFWHNYFNRDWHSRKQQKLF